LLDRATELGGEGLPGLSLGLRFRPFGRLPSVVLKEPDIGGVARAPRVDGIEVEYTESAVLIDWYREMPDHSLPATDTGDRVPERPFMMRSYEFRRLDQYVHCRVRIGSEARSTEVFKAYME